MLQYQSRMASSFTASFPDSQIPAEDRPCSGIVYARTKAMCDTIAEHLKEKGIRAEPYHRGIRPGVLEKTMRGWVNGEGVTKADRVDVVCATSTSPGSPLPASIQ